MPEQKPFSLADVPEMIYIELGLSGLLMAIAIMYLLKELYFTKKQVSSYKKDNSELVEKLHQLGVEMTSGITSTHNTLEKLYSLFIKFLVGDKDKEKQKEGTKDVSSS